eukprot:GILK01001632.1.p1 GENE.GILK01001632.1~~GILK01001632.1.p1  ORF type:complete len:182 (+),score=17.65 GILK01001632.1:45-548(+)
MEQVVQNRVLLLRLWTGVAAVCELITGILGLADLPDGSKYLVGLICAYIAVFSVAVLLTEFSPLGLSKLINVFPFLEEYFGRGVFYIIIGSFTLQPVGKAGSFAIVSGVFMMVAGFFSIVAHYFWGENPTAERMGGGPYRPSGRGGDDELSNPLAASSEDYRPPSQF